LKKFKDERRHCKPQESDSDYQGLCQWMYALRRNRKNEKFEVSVEQIGILDELGFDGNHLGL